MAEDLKPFVPLNAPPSDYHNINTGVSTELGDSARGAFQKINDGFKHVYDLLSQHAKAVAAPVETATAEIIAAVKDWAAQTFVSLTTHEELKSANDALATRVDELEAKLKYYAQAVDDFVKTPLSIDDPSITGAPASTGSGGTVQGDGNPNVPVPENGQAPAPAPTPDPAPAPAPVVEPTPEPAPAPAPDPAPAPVVADKDSLGKPVAQ